MRGHEIDASASKFLCVRARVRMGMTQPTRSSTCRTPTLEFAAKISRDPNLGLVGTVGVAVVTTLFGATGVREGGAASRLFLSRAASFALVGVWVWERACEPGRGRGRACVIKSVGAWMLVSFFKHMFASLYRWTRRG
eukprot:1960734-Pleurochrysis_carterae.AAC.1